MKTQERVVRVYLRQTQPGDQDCVEVRDVMLVDFSPHHGGGGSSLGVVSPDGPFDSALSLLRRRRVGNDG